MRSFLMFARIAVNTGGGYGGTVEPFATDRAVVDLPAGAPVARVVMALAELRPILWIERRVQHRVLSAEVFAHTLPTVDVSPQSNM